MNRGGRFRGNKHHQHRNEKKSNSASSNADDCNPIVKCFRGYANELDDKHDRYERIVKYSRDITIESKRLIFLLHTIDMRNSNAEKTLTEAFNRLNTLCTNSFANIAKELDGLDPYQYGRAYSAGLQEFVEAYTYYDYLANNNCSINWNDLQKKLTYGPKKPEDFPEIAAAVQEVSGTPEMETKCLIQPMEFMLGLADISGEVMRKCINALGSGDIDACRTACNFIQHLYSGYLSFNVRNREMGRKIHAMFQSVLKVEKVCYNVTVRGKEAAIWSSSDATIDKERDDIDEGFINF